MSNKTVVGLCSGVFVAGIIVTMLVDHSGCTLTGGSSVAAWSLGCGTAPCEGTKVKIKLADRAKISLRGALEYLQMQTASRPGSQVYVDPEVLAADFSKTEVELPNDYMAAVPLVRTLLQQSMSQKNIDVCLEPEGGFRLKLARAHP